MLVGMVILIAGWHHQESLKLLGMCRPVVNKASQVGIGDQSQKTDKSGKQRQASLTQCPDGAGIEVMVDHFGYCP